MRRMRRWLIFSILIGIGAIMILSMLYAHQRGNEIAQLSEKIEVLRNVRLLHSLSNQELLKIRYQLFSNYDELAEYSKELRSHIAAMTKLYSPIIGASDKFLSDDFSMLKTQLEMKLELQGQYKAANAIMKNSLLRIKDISIKIKKSRQPYPVAIKYFSELNENTLQFELVNDKMLISKLTQLISQLKRSETGITRLPSHLKNLLTHANIVIEKGNISKDLLAAIIAIPLETSIERIQTQYQTELQSIKQQTNRVRNITYSTSIFLLVYTLLSFVRLSHRKKALAREKESAQITLQSIGDGVISTDENGIIQFINPMGEQITKWSSEEAKGKELSKVFRVFDGVNNSKVDNIIHRCINEKRKLVSAAQSILIDKNNEQIDIEDTFAPILDMENNVAGTIVVFRDVSDTRALSKQLQFQAIHDALTGVINRHGFDQALANLIRSSRREGQVHALLYLDLDQFKVINDTCGHDAGDHLLIQVTKLFQNQLPKSATLARLGGDEFGILLSQCHIHDAERFACSLLESIKQFRFEWHGIVFQIGASIGLAPISDQSGSASLLLSAADMACYVAKDLGRNRVHVFNPDDKELVRRQGEMEWVAKLTTAFREERFCLYSQKITALNHNTEAEHYELLLRLKDSDGKLIAPDSFIPAAERYNFMPTLDRWVIHNTFSRFRWFDSSASYSINLSGTSLNSDTLVAYIQDELNRSSLSPSQVCFEVTETAAIANLKAAAKIIQQIKSLGFHFALDDFGQGLSSYTYLNNLPVDFLKIDGEFVRTVNTDPVSYEIVSSIQKISHLLGMQTIAEYVEDEHILNTLIEIGVDHVQGFHFGSPTPLSDEFEAQSAPDFERQQNRRDTKNAGAGAGLMRELTIL